MNILSEQIYNKYTTNTTARIMSQKLTRYQLAFASYLSFSILLLCNVLAVELRLRRDNTPCHVVVTNVLLFFAKKFKKTPYCNYTTFISFFQRKIMVGQNYVDIPCQIEFRYLPHSCT